MKKFLLLLLLPVAAFAQIETSQIEDNAVTNAKQADMNGWTLKGRNSGVSGNPTDIAADDIQQELSPTAGHFLIGFDSADELIKVDWDDLPSGGGGVSDGDKGDITVSGSGSTWSIDADTIGLTELEGTIESAIAAANSALQPGDNVSDLTNDSGYLTGYTVTEGDVTTHEAALEITESQITDLTHTDPEQSGIYYGSGGLSGSTIVDTGGNDFAITDNFTQFYVLSTGTGLGSPNGTQALEISNSGLSVNAGSFTHNGSDVLTTDLSADTTIDTNGNNLIIEDVSAETSGELELTSTVSSLKYDGNRVVALGSGVWMVFEGDDDLQLNYDPGAAGEVIMSNGANLPPTWEDLSPTYMQTGNSDTSTTLDASASWVAAPIFGSVRASNGSDFTLTSSTVVTVNFTGAVRLSATAYMACTGMRAAPEIRFYNGGAAFGPVAGSYARNANSHDNTSTTIAAFITDVTSGDTIELKIRSGSTVTGTCTFSGGNVAQVLFERIK